MECQICKRSDRQLVDAIYDNEIAHVCKACAEFEGIPIINKPTEEQLAAAQKRLPLTETIARMNNPRFVRTMSHDQSIANRNLSKIRFPAEKQMDAKLIENYYWELQMARRRKKLPVSEVAKITHIPEDIIHSLERGILPPTANIEPIMKTLELALNVRLLKTHSTSVHFKMPLRSSADAPIGERAQIDAALSSEENIVHKQAQEHSSAPAPVASQSEPRHSRNLDVLSRISQGKADFSKENMSSINVRDLAGSERRPMPEGWGSRPRVQGHQLESQNQQHRQSQQQEQKAKGGSGSSASPSGSDKPDVEFFE